MRHTLKMFLIGVSAIGVNIPTLAAAQSIDTVTPYTSSYLPFGESDTSAYGQTFTVGSDTYLTSFSLFLTGEVSNPVDFNAYLYAWDGNSLTGSALYGSSLMSFGGSAEASPTEFAFNTGSLQLTTGSQYIAFLFADFAGAPSTASMPQSTSGYVGGGFAFDNNFGNFAALVNPWDAQGQLPDVWFRASLSREGITSGVPEPSTWAMMLMGFGAMGVAMRRRRKSANLAQLA